MLHKLKNWRNNRRLYVIADPADSGITLSHALFKHMKASVDDNAEAKVFVFFIPESSCYGFMLNPDIDQPTQLCDIQYNAKYKCIGFETLCPTVNRILYDYGVTVLSKPCKLSVSVHSAANGQSYYQIEHPHAKFIKTFPPK